MSLSEVSGARAWIRWIGLIAGPSLAIFTFFLLPDSYTASDSSIVAFSSAGRITLSIMVWMAIWWLSEAIHISATALLPLVVLPMTGAASTAGAAQPYAHPLVFMIMGGFLIALSMQKWGLDKRVALVTLKFAGTDPRNMIAGFMLVTALLSAFVSNTATTAMMLPIALSMIELVRSSSFEGSLSANEEQCRNFAICVLLGLAYGSSVGGISTIIGTAPNAFLVAFINETIAPQYRTEVSFSQWLILALPFTMIFLPIIWLVLTRLVYPVRLPRIAGGAQLIEEGLKKLGRPNRGECITAVVFLFTAALWVFRPYLVKAKLMIPAGADGELIALSPLSGLSDPVIAMLGAIILFVIPVSFRRMQFTLDWETAMRLPWGILLLFGGGLSLSEAVQLNGVAEFIGSQASHFAGLPIYIHVLVVTAAVVFLTELTSNVATTAALLPVLAALAPGLGIHPFLLIFPAAIAASCAFMMPVATPPNAIVFGSGEVTIAQMIRAGFWLNLVAITLIVILTFTVLPHVLGLSI